MMVSAEGGVNIEEVAVKNPDAIVKFPIDIHDGLSQSKAQEAAVALGFPSDRLSEVADVSESVLVWLWRGSWHNHLSCRSSSSCSIYS